MNLLFDTETNGKWAKNFPVGDERQPHLVQYAAILANDKAEILSEVSVIVEPADWEIGEEVAKIHGISNELALVAGLPRKLVLSLFNNSLKKALRVVAHNLDFDELIMMAQFLRERQACRINQLTKICTMRSSTKVCKIPNPYYRPGRDQYKWPTLTELHQHLFGKGFEGAHDALNDVRALYRCFFRLVEMGAIEI